MLSPERAVELMLEAIKESEKSIPEDGRIHPKVGAILADLSGNILERSHRDETGNGDHCEYILIKKAEDKGINLAESVLFVTLEPCTSRGAGKIPCAKRIVDGGIQKVYLGMLDPNPIICGRGETFLRIYTTLERFPAALVKMIEESNEEFINIYRSELLPDSSLYVSKQIVDLMIEKLQRDGLQIKELPTDWELVIDDIIHYCQSNNLGGKDKIYDLVINARNEAYDKKYSDYTYEKDSRGLGNYWIREIDEVLENLNIKEISKYSVINVGSGNGLEAKALFNDVSDLTLVDIGPKSLQKAQALITHANLVQNGAENLSQIATNSKEVYVSLRTYQSSFFDIDQSIREAYRVLRPGGVIIISVANGFIGENNILIPGLVIPKTKVVDKNRPFEVVDKIRRKLSMLRFDSIGIRTGQAEIYIYGRCH